MPRRGSTIANWFVPIFFLSGFAGLAYQVVWTKSLAAAIGHEYPAMLAVVSAFMSGMAAGNLILARFRRIDSRCYGWLEILIGLWAIALAILTPFVQSLVFRALGLTPSAALHWTIVFVFVLVALFPATAAMGATLAAAERFLTGTVGRHTTGLLYGANTAGAMFGAIGGAFWLMPQFGLGRSAYILAAVNLACGVAALVLVKNAGSSAPAASSVRRIPGELAMRLLVTGILGIGFEVAIVRGLSQVLENTVYTFAVVLATYLGGTAAGAMIFHRSQSARASSNASWLFAALSFSTVAAGIALRWAPRIYGSLRSSFGDSLAAVAMAETSVAAVLFLIPAVCMGAIWAWLAQSSLGYRPSLAWALCLNMAGSALGPIIWGLAIIPWGGLKSALTVVPIGYALLGGRRSLVMPGIAALAVSVFGIPFMAGTRNLVDASGGRIISLREGVMGSVVVLESSDGSRVLKFNNRFQMGGTAARIAEQRQADIPLLLHPNPERALFIGLGTGITFAAAGYYPNLVADGVELVPEIAGSMALFSDSTFKSSNLRVFVADGRRYVRAARTRYDVIVADLFHPAQDGAGFLYTREHFQAIRERLEENGLFCQWLPLHQMDLDTFDVVGRTFESVFPNAQIWLLRFNVDTPVVGLIGFKGHGGYRIGIVEQWIAQGGALAGHLRSVGVTDSVRLFGCYIGEVISDRKHLTLNTDLNPTVIFRAPAITFRRVDNPAERLLGLIEKSTGNSEALPWSPSSITEAREMAPRIGRFIEARNVYLRGLARQLIPPGGTLASDLAAYIESARISPDFTAGYAQALAIATAMAESNPESAKGILRALVEAQPERPVARELLDRLNERR